MNIEQLQELWDADCAIDDNYLGEQSTATPKLHAKYVKLLVQVKLKHTKLQSDYNLLRKNKFRYYRGELSRDELNDLGWAQWQGVKPLKNEMDEFLSGDTDLNTLRVKIDYLETMIYFLESIMGQIKARDWQIKTAVEWKKFLAGM
ncbi:Recombination, repair and ssDNA binding protein UvsY [uncultured Caudovirales phage]|uniref:Recombination, repair and ssDNA binding protein UvsY n=1 Tax=uncultured Caudovirales phage TaxID=2100421 RepID=A0A6J7WX80_9CAUD|nr:Recombination, repair and ssDNA binding protein UvsY [uncultured Caudovirales phage]